MRTIGIIGGMSAESTALYYARLNAEARRRLGELHSAEVLIWSVDFAEIADMQSRGAWDDAGRRLADVARRLERGGAEVLILATNTMHKVAETIQAAVRIPLLHIADATAKCVATAGCKRPGLLGTRYTMEQEFYKGRITSRFGLDVLVPDEADRAEAHRVVYDELCRGVVQADSKRAFETIAERLVERGADCLILGCTEVGMLLDQPNVRVPVFDTTLIHADAALDWALAAHSASSKQEGATGTHG